MRTATTIAETHKGKEILLSGRNVPIQEQLQAFRQLLGRKSHPEFAAVQIQESDGHSRILKFMTPAAEEKHLDARAKESEALKAQAEKDRKASEEVIAKNAKALEKEHGEFIEKVNKERLADLNRTGSGSKAKEAVKAPE